MARERVTLLGTESTTAVESTSIEGTSVNGSSTEESATGEMLTNDSSIERRALERRRRINRPVETGSTEEDSAAEESEHARPADNAFVIDQWSNFVSDDSVDNLPIDEEHFIDVVRDYGEFDGRMAQELAGLTNLVAQEKEYAEPNADWAAIWKDQTPSFLYRNRGDNQPIIRVIDRLLDALKTERENNNYREVEGILRYLDEDLLTTWLEGYDGSRRDAAVRLHNAVKLQRHRERLGLQLVRNYAIKPDSNVKKFAEDPFETYDEISKRMRDHHQVNPGDQNFPFSEIAFTLENMQNHIRDIRRRLLFGGEDAEQQDGGRVQVHANVPERLKDELLPNLPELGNRSLLERLNEDIEALKQRGYPYKDTIELIIKFMKVIDYITFRAKTEIEINKALAGTGKTSADFGPTREDKAEIASLIKNHRGNKFGDDLSVTSNFPFYADQVTAEKIYLEQYRTAGPQVEDPTVSRTGIYRFEKLHAPGHSPADPGPQYRLQWLIDNPDMILFPSYNPLDEKFFGRVRGVPIYMVGMINTEYLNADNIRQSPATFFEHDLFHIMGYSDGDTKQQFATLMDRLERWTREGATKEEVYRFWSNNWLDLEKKIEEINEDIPQDVTSLKDAIYKVLFMALHEPEAGVGNNLELIDQPTVLESELLTQRLSITWSNLGQNHSLTSKLKERIQRGEFGEVAPGVVAQLENATDWLLTNVPDIFRTQPERAFNNFL